MSTVEIKITTDGLDHGQAAALSNFLTSLGTTTPEVKTETPSAPFYLSTEAAEAVAKSLEPVEEETTAPVKRTRNRAKKEEAPAPVEDVEVNEPEEVTEEATEDVVEDLDEQVADMVDDAKDRSTLMQIRSLVAQKSANHKEVLRAKLKEYGVANVSTLEEKHYSDFHAFTDALA